MLLTSSAAKLGLEYKPFRINYSLTSAGAYRDFIVYLMEGHFGLRATSLLRKPNNSMVRAPTDNPTPDLPSWVPDLANRDYFGLSMHGGSVGPDMKSQCLNILGTHHNPERTFLGGREQASR